MRWRVNDFVAVVGKVHEKVTANQRKQKSGVIDRSLFRASLIDRGDFPILWLR